MTPFEEQLRKALARQEPPAGFTERLLAQLPAARPIPRKSAPWRLAVAAAAVLGLAGATAFQQYQHHLQGEAARRQLLLAMRVTSSKLQLVQQRLQQSEVNQ